MSVLTKIHDYIVNNSNFHSDCYNPDEDSLEDFEAMTSANFGTRENGNVGDEQYSEIDWKEGEDLIREINVRFPDHGFELELDYFDEWVHLNIDPK